VQTVEVCKSDGISETVRVNGGALKLGAVVCKLVDKSRCCDGWMHASRKLERVLDQGAHGPLPVHEEEPQL